MYYRAVLVVCVLLVALGGGTVWAGDIVTVPTANQVKAGEIDVADYYIFVDNDALIEPIQPLDIDFVRAQTFYMGLTDEVEIDIHRYDVDVLGADTIFNATVLVLKEDMKKPNVVIGGRDLSNVYGNASYFLSAAKTLNPPVGGPPTKPIVRLHLSLGTEDNTLFAEGRHEGLFGGIQVLFRPANPAVGLVALHDGTDVITGLTVVPKPGWPTLKGGTFGGHLWVGASYTFNAK
ncbi:MAG: hypothetical protein JXA57_07570 [Armatimonadetes bacterium]|nr:hypothetical protein [Armatimonadota bacterium]